VRDDVPFAVAIVDERLENLDFLACDLGPTQAPDQFFALAAEHAAGNHFNPAVVRRPVNDVHGDPELKIED
jgi:hypothetical protein